jgi:2-polyprenyl-6-methoxyphenol hydroxylase-like FAD-dependent oxidoreductase
MTALDEIAERNARAHVLAAATGMGLTPAQEDVATLLDALADVARATSGAVARTVQLLRQRDTLVTELARARGCSESVVRVGAGIEVDR